MQHWNDRYECILEPTETWLVWDRWTQDVSEQSGVALVGLADDEAFAICRLLNAREAA